MKALGMMLLLVGMGAVLSAQRLAPEIDGASAGSAIALLSGAVLVIKSRRKK
jgi:hypothetical protein